MKEKIQDLADAIKGVAGEVVAEDAVPYLAKEILKGTAIEAASGAISMISPRIGGIMVAYQQKRWERNWERYLAIICERQDALNERLEQLNKEMLQKFKQDSFPLVSDFVQNEKQEEKIDMIVNGLINIASGMNAQDDIILMYYETLEQLSLLDIRILRLYFSAYNGSEDDNIQKVIQECQIDSSQVKLVREKLDRLGLIQSRNEEKTSENIESIIQYLNDVSKGKKNAKLRHIKHVPKSETYKITSFGVRFIRFFTELYESDEAK